jgi:Carboxypeptidase regulatory-like domain
MKLKISLRLFFAKLCLLVTVSVLPWGTSVAQSGMNRPRLSQTASGKSVVTGRVIYKDNGQPLKGTRVRIFTSDDSGQILYANERGEFRLGGLAAGKYYVTVEGPEVASPSGFGMRIPLPMTAIPRREDFEEIVPRHDAQFVVDGTDAVEVEVRIARGGSASGKVLKANGAPVTGAPVSFISRENLGAPYTARFSSETDKDGNFKINHLPEGDYIVATATEDNHSTLDIRARLRGEGQVITYHPAASVLSRAQTVHVDAGRETGGVNITLVARNAFKVSGTLLRQRDGTPIAGATVVLKNKEAEVVGGLVPGIGQKTTHTDSDGRWAFANVIDGAYVVTALVTPDRPTISPGEPPDREEMFRRSRQRFQITQQEISVANADLDGVLMSLSGPGSIAGRVESDSGGPLPANLVIFFELISPGSRPAPPLPVRVGPDGAFNFGNVQGGEVYLSVALAPDMKYFVKSVDANGVDPQRSPVRITEGAESGPVRIVISQGLGVLTGRVLVDNSAPASSGIVVLLAPVESSKQRFRTAYLSTRVTADGTFSVSGPPGEYFVFAGRRDELPPIMSEEFVRGAGGKAVRVTLVAGTEKHLDVRAE